MTEKLIGHYVLHADQPAPDPDVTGPWYSLQYQFVIEAGESRLPKPPITGKASGARPVLEVLQRR